VSSSRGRLPALSTRGAYVLALAIVLLILGVGYGSFSLALTGLGCITLLFCAYLSFASRVALLWRRYLELVWWLPRAASNEGLIAHRTFEVQVALRNLGPIALGHAELRVFCSRCIVVARPLSPVLLLPRSQATARLELRALQAGQWMIHGAAVRLWDRFGLFAIEAYYPSALALKVLPRPQPKLALLPTRSRGGGGEDRLGAHTLRRRGLGGELRELREYVPGDPFKLIAWKASARSPLGRPLVRELEREMLLSHYILIDIGVTMREGRPGQWKLDHMIELSLGYAAAALAEGDRVGLIAFDGAVYSHLKPGDGSPQRLRITERLIALMNVVEEGFVAMTDGELTAAVARYLRQQEGLDARIRRAPKMEDQTAWAGIAVAPSGELFEIAPLVAAARRLLPSRIDRKAGADDLYSSLPPGVSASAGSGGNKPVAPSGSSDLALLRRLCRHRGIELPYGQRSSGSRAQGLAAALELAAAQNGTRVLLLSDLLGMDEDAQSLSRAGALCRKRALEVRCIQPLARRYVPKELFDDPASARAAEIFCWEQERQEARMHRMLAKIGCPVIAVGPEDGLVQIFAKATSKPQRQTSAISSDAGPKTSS
jgi:uncharacterized protein (DUF58 family)